MLTAFTVEAALGFGATLVTVALGSLLVPIDQLLPAFVPLNLAMSLYLSLRHRRHVDGRLLLRRVLPLMGLGLPFGMLAFARLETGHLQLAFGVFVVGLSGLELGGLARRPELDARPLQPSAAGVLLFLGGVVHGAFATGGPMAVYVSGRELPDKARFRATLSVLWLALNTALLLHYATSGALTPATGLLSAQLVLPLGLGLLAGEWAHRRVPLAGFRALVFALLLVAGVSLAWRAA